MAPINAASTAPAAGRITRPGSSRPLRGAVVAALAALGLLLSLVAAAGPAQAATTRRTSTEVSYSKAVLKVLNSERKAHHLPALRMDSHLRLSARWHNLSMAKHNTMSHQLPGEADFARRIDKAGYHWTYAGENIGWNSMMNKRGVVMLETMMYHEKAPNNGHRLNILSGHYKNVGVDVYLDKKHHKVWLTTDFDRR